MFYYEAYKKLDQFAKFHELKLVKGHFTNINSSDQYIDEKKFEINLNKDNFVIALFTKEKEKIYLAICKYEFFGKSENAEKLLNLTRDRDELILIPEHILDNGKLDSIIKNNKLVNVIYIQSLLTGGPLNHINSPKSAKIIDYEPIQEFTKIKKKDLPTFSFRDPLIAWMRFRVGDVIEIIDYAPNCGQVVTYRLIT